MLRVGLSSYSFFYEWLRFSCFINLSDVKYRFWVLLHIDIWTTVFSSSFKPIQNIFEIKTSKLLPINQFQIDKNLSRLRLSKRQFSVRDSEGERNSQCFWAVYSNTVTVPQRPFSPNLAPFDFFLFPKIESTLKGHRFTSTTDI